MSRSPPIIAPATAAAASAGAKGLGGNPPEAATPHRASGTVTA